MTMTEGVQILQPVSGALTSATELQEMLGTNAAIEIVHASPEAIAALIPKGDAEDEQSVVAQAEALIAQNAVTGTPTLQSLLAAPVTNNQVQIVTVASSPSNQTDGSDKVWQVVPSSLNSEVPTIIAVNTNNFENKGEQQENSDNPEANEVAVCINGSESTMMLVSSIPELTPLPPNCPSWAARLQNCQMIGNAYRGYVESEIEVDLLLTYHKQETRSFWGTRQSPSPAKPSTRLMWKSQYVPFDGIPFVNTGSRAIVMECQFGPRRKGNFMMKKLKNTAYQQTCPARIYIKKVKKFPEYAVDTSLDKKLLKLSMDKSFQELRTAGFALGEERYYIQLPTESAHQFHDEESHDSSSHHEESETSQDDLNTVSRLDPRVYDKIRNLVASGESRVYAIRKQLRHFVTRKLYPSSDSCPERHDLTLFPTVNDLKNHIHQATKDLESGKLPRIVPEEEQQQEEETTNEFSQIDTSNIWQIDGASVSKGTTTPTAVFPETVTVTLTQTTGEDGQHVISQIETHLSDGTKQISTTLTPETAQILSKLSPGLISADFMMESPVQTEVQSNLISDEAATLDNSVMVAEESEMDVNTNDQSNTDADSFKTVPATYSPDQQAIMTSPQTVDLQTVNTIHQIVEISGHSIPDNTHIINETQTESQTTQTVATENEITDALTKHTVKLGKRVQKLNEIPSKSARKV